MQFCIPLIVADTRGPRNGLHSPTCLYDSFAVYMILHLFKLSCVRASIVKSSCDIWSTFFNVFFNLERNIMKF
jgi:hypothetical protein